MNNALNIVRIVLLSIIAAALIFLLVILLNGKINIKGIDLYEKTSLVYEKEFTESINNLNIVTTNNDVKILEKEIENIEVKVYDKKDVKPDAYVKDDTLYIHNKDEIRLGFTFGILGSSRIEITVPKGTTYNLIVEGTSSDIESLIDLKNVNINTKSGDINIKNAINAEIQTTSGDTKVLSISKSLKVKATSGDMIIESVDGKLNLETTSGDIKIGKLNLTSNSSIGVTSGDVIISKTNDIYIDAHVVSGDTRINTNNRKADVELKVKTISGDIIVNN